MKHRLRPGDYMPEFSYDTPYEPQNSFFALLEADERPLFMIFLRNFGHPFTRHYIVRYAQTIQQLYSARLVCVVRTRPETIGPHLPKGTMPYPVICDAEGALYDYFEIPRIRGRMRTLSWEGLRILKEARKQGYQESREVPQQMPLTLLIAPSGEVLLAHYGTSVTDQPEDCEAMEVVCQELFHAAEQERKKAVRKGKPGEPLPEAALSSLPRPRREPVQPSDEEDLSLGELTLTGPDLPSPPPKTAPAPAPKRSAVPIRLNEPLPIMREQTVSAPPVVPKTPEITIPLPLPSEKAQREEAKRQYTLWAAAEPKPESSQTPAPDVAPAMDPEPEPVSKEDPAPAPAETTGPSAAAPAPAPEEKLPPVQPAITSPSGPAAEDIALQKFRSAAAALFSDEF